MKPVRVLRAKFVQWFLLSGLACVIHVIGYRDVANLIMIFSGFLLASREEVSRSLKWREVVRMLAGGAVLLSILLYGSIHWWNGNGAGAYQAESWVNHLWYVGLWLSVSSVLWFLSRTVPAVSSDEVQDKPEGITGA